MIPQLLDRKPAPGGSVVLSGPMPLRSEFELVQQEEESTQVRRHPKAPSVIPTQERRSRPSLLGLLVLSALCLAAWMALGAAPAAAACSNEELRLRQGSTNLPECRGWELVSPVNKGGGAVLASGNSPDSTIFFPFEFSPLSSTEGNALAYTMRVTPDETDPTSSGLGSSFLARRGSDGWATEQMDPPINPATFELSTNIFQALTPDLGFGGVQGPKLTPINPSGSEGTRNLFVRDNSLSSFSPLGVGLPPNSGAGEGGLLQYEAMAADGSHVVFSSKSPLTPGSTTAPYLYDWNRATESLTLLSNKGSVIRPTGDNGGDLNPSRGTDQWHEVSEDGSRVFFKGDACPTENCVWLDNTTIQSIGNALSFWLASSDGSTAFFTTGALSSDLGTTADLVRYDVDADESVEITENGEVLGVLGGSEDASRVYFAAKAVLASGATAGKQNIYLWTDDGSAKGAIQFVAKGEADEAFQQNWGNAATSKVSPDGGFLAFQTDQSLTGYPNAGNLEIYGYSAADEELRCVSCNPSGEPATSDTLLVSYDRFQHGRYGRNEQGHSRRKIRDDGDVYFDSAESLVEGDVNNRQDVYRYDWASGELSLISSGTSQYDNWFTDASADGRDVFFATHEQLVAADHDDLIDVYDAHVDGGFPGQNPLPSPAPCAGEECRGASGAPSLEGAASAAFNGRGNLRQKGNCGSLERKAKSLRKQSTQARQQAKQASGKKAASLRKKANRLSKQSSQAKKRANRCKSGNGRAGA